MPKVIKDKEAMQKRGEILYELRKQKGIKQSTVADILGISQQAYLKYEHGEADPTIDALIKLSDFYKVSIEFLLGLDTERPQNPFEMLGLDTSSKNVVEEFAGLPDDSRKFILDIVIKLAHAAEGISDNEEQPPLTLTRTLGQLEDETKARSAEDQDGGKFA